MIILFFCLVLSIRIIKNTKFYHLEKMDYIKGENVSDDINTIYFSDYWKEVYDSYEISYIEKQNILKSVYYVSTEVVPNYYKKLKDASNEEIENYFYKNKDVIYIDIGIDNCDDFNNFIRSIKENVNSEVSNLKYIQAAIYDVYEEDGKMFLKIYITYKNVDNEIVIKGAINQTVVDDTNLIVYTAT